MNTHIGALEFTHDFANGYPTFETIDRLVVLTPVTHAAESCEVVWEPRNSSGTRVRRGIYLESVRVGTFRAGRKIIVL